MFEAARVDGAGPFRLFWSIVLPMSKPILGVVSVFAISTLIPVAMFVVFQRQFLNSAGLG